MPIFNFEDARDVTPGALREGLEALRELVPAGYAAEVTRALDFHGDRMGSYLDADIEGTFSDPEVQESVRGAGFCLPLTRKVIERLALLYKREPARRLRPLDSAGTEDLSKAERLYGEIAFQGRLSQALRQALKFTNLLGTAFVQVAVSGDRLRFDVLSGKDVLLAPPADGRVGDLSEYEALVLPKPYLLDGRRVFAFWSSRFHFLFDEDGRLVDDLGDPRLANPFGRIPFVRVDRDPAVDLYPPPPESLVDANRRLNFAVTELFYTKKFQSGLGLVAYGIYLIVSKQLDAGVQAIGTGLTAIFVRDAIATSVSGS